MGTLCPHPLPAPSARTPCPHTLPAHPLCTPSFSPFSLDPAPPQTGSGKTHTMFGPTDPHATTGDGTLGLVPRVCEELIDATAARNAQGFTSKLSVAYVEVFCAEVT